VLIPLGTDRPLRRTSVVTPTLIALCTAVYTAQLLLDPRAQAGQPDFTSRFWVVGGDQFALWRTVTSTFFHGGVIHLLGNMLFLWVFGRAVEDRMGRLAFAAFYLGGGAFSGLMHALFETAPAIGASGAIAAVTGAFLVLFPRTRIKVLWFFILISLVQAPAWFFIGLQIAWNLLAQATGRQGEVAVLAHLAGYAYGFLLAFILLTTGVLAREPYDLFTISRQAKRRRDFRAAASTAPARRPAPRKPADERTEAIARARAAVSGPLSRGVAAEAVEPYRLLLDRFGRSPGAAVLSRNAQYQLGAHLYAEGPPDLALRVFTDFAETYAEDPDTPQIRILIARLLASQGRPEEARRALTAALESIDDPDLEALARDELAALAPRTPSPGTHP